ncbi:ABC transporter substrate-binding protein [Mesorhizobium sp. M6A.T.Cr.TU.016.01.1.1]|uniref:ABC transporter substrate-binding protein n=1 Tax=Mesorhizobium sp. M6A.T.Cr.TU.016.01.1.1 TaxID=2493677 RepID=UPI000F75657D|nr:ABC transporter substrate-binding protein [Mesorhizobium sp. M6A.T.Cr.TU.016.01.1.1]AZO68064.1 ABC transporter substrate-binding protein [Mesorhizobium sp. M6A.T.Cr.TU.016.01.1.1]
MVKRALSASVVGLVASCFATAALSQGLPKNEEVRATGKFKISNSLAYAPFEYVDEAGKPVGLDIELADAVAHALGAELEIVRMPFASQIPSLASERTKVAWATFSVTPERLKQVDFITFLSAATVFVVPAENASKFKSKDDLCGTSIAVQTGSAADFAADKLNEDCKSSGRAEIKKSIYPEQKDAIQAVLTERVVGRLDDSTAAGYYASESNGKMVVVPGSYFPTPLGVAVAKGDSASAEMMRAVLQKVMDDGTYEKIIDKFNMATSAVSKSEIITSADQLPK